MTVPSQDDLDVADALGGQLVRFYRAMAKTKSYLSKIGPDGIERAAYAILFYLVNNGPQRTSALADALHSDISTVSRQSSTLVQHGLVERTADPEDGRATLLAPTGEGLRVFEENRQLRARWIASMLQEWPREDRVAVATLLDRLNAEIEQFQEGLSETTGDGTASAEAGADTTRGAAEGGNAAPGNQA
ncbi:DNA-binding MarR family transcriptional regulator [Prauserella sediminis]|uniref:DNA-binding MarR family transcriptional regulator n=1 Tax=Prauserella sediminis TaxID=577680 RepID=A0A839XSW5_9PSEU|nr:MarR family transcriptional regulator [Prauserella sediminis]MBB3662935.1 DNA-binding MarR family transcriptional regulator [Prauserella sediminis]